MVVDARNGGHGFCFLVARAPPPGPTIGPGSPRLIHLFPGGLAMTSFIFCLIFLQVTIFLAMGIVFFTGIFWKFGAPAHVVATDSIGRADPRAI